MAISSWRSTNTLKRLRGSQERTNTIITDNKLWLSLWKIIMTMCTRSQQVDGSQSWSGPRVLSPGRRDTISRVDCRTTSQLGASSPKGKASQPPDQQVKTLNIIMLLTKPRPAFSQLGEGRSPGWHISSHIWEPGYLVTNSSPNLVTHWIGSHMWWQLRQPTFQWYFPPDLVTNGVTYLQPKLVIQ